MKEFKGLQFEEFVESDVEILTPLMKSAFDEDAKRNLNKESGGPPGYDNGDFLREWALHKDSTAYKVSKDSRPVGAVILWINPNNENFLGNIYIDAKQQDKGFGTIIWEFVESEFPNTTVWRTATPGYSRRNHYFYVNKCGFKIFKIEDPKDKHKASYHMEKWMNTDH